MDDAAKLSPGSVVVAESQTAGQGRMGRQWHSEKGAGLYFSAVIALPCPAEHVPVITLALGLAAQDAIQQVTGIGCDLRWPNDLLLSERKCGGILVQLHGDRIVSGIGVNVNQEGFPSELIDIATSLRAHTGQKIPKEKLLLTILAEIANYCGLLEKEGRDSILRLFAQSSSYVYGRSVVVDSAEAVVAGTTDGLDESGFLWIRADDGRRRLIRAGGVRPR